MSVEIARDMINNAQEVPLGGLRQLENDLARTWSLNSRLRGF
jgi:hypothetical protein